MTEDFVYNPPLFPFLDVLYEDDDIMVVNKPSGLLSVPGRLKEHHDSILSRIKSSYPDAFAVKIAEEAGIELVRLGDSKEE